MTFLSEFFDLGDASGAELKEYSVEDIHHHFKLPIFYNPSKEPIAKHIVEDLEMERNLKDANTSHVCLYDKVFAPKEEDVYSVEMMNAWKQYYTTDIAFLKDTQELLASSSLGTPASASPPYKPTYTKINEIWKEVKSPYGFLEKYQYIDWKKFAYLNESASFLQVLSMYNIASPLLSLCVPIISMIMPYLILRIQGIQITLKMYFAHLIQMIQNNSFGKIIYHLIRFEWDKCAYALFTAGMYVFQIYVNILSCIRFVHNTGHLHDYLIQYRDYLKYTVERMDQYMAFTGKLATYTEFHCTMMHHRRLLNEFYEEIRDTKPFSLFSWSSLSDLGHKMKWFYELHFNKTYESAFLYSFGFNGFCDNIESLSIQLRGQNTIHLASFKKPKKNKETGERIPSMKCTNAYYPMTPDKPVKNSFHLDKQLILTGPNASGKTTFIKTALINVILSQQIGCGFYDSYIATPYKYIHCYLNIPDTSGRDSLFQAEARRCKEIIHLVKSASKSYTHFCIFDEIFSGTNPSEAVSSAYGFIKYICNRSNVHFVLTTHFIDLCEKLEEKEKDRIANHQMNVEIESENGRFHYTYQVSEGISKIKGGIKVLTEMDFPEEILAHCHS